MKSVIREMESIPYQLFNGMNNMNNIYCVRTKFESISLSNKFPICDLFKTSNAVILFQMLQSAQLWKNEVTIPELRNGNPNIELPVFNNNYIDI